MKRKELVDKLINEGFTTNTLCNLSDKQIELLSSRIINEQKETTINVSKDDKVSIENAKKTKKPFMTYEEEETCEDCNKEYHPMTTKKEISEMIQSKLKNK